jgi:hypothetical protein
MTTGFTIPFTDILEKAFKLREENPELSIDELLKEILPTISIKFESNIQMNIRKKTIKDDMDDDSDMVRKKTLLTSEERCMARTIYENIHLEKGLLKVMRDDPKNLYGDQCKCRKKEMSLFCTRHSNWQSLGVWNGEYSGKFSDYVEKTKTGNVCQIVDDEDEPPKPVPKPKKEKEVKVDVKPKEKMVKAGDTTFTLKPATNLVKPSEETSDDEDSVDAYPITIEGIEYNIDESNHVWTDDGDLIGVYDRSKKTWVSKI